VYNMYTLTGVTEERPSLAMAEAAISAGAATARQAKKEERLEAPEAEELRLGLPLHGARGG
jgi:hypothetical protein